MKLIPIRIDGEGYRISISPDAQAKKAALLKESTAIKVVTTNEQAEIARYALKELTEFTSLLEKARKEVKAPVLQAGERIDTAAKDCAREVEAEKGRITALIQQHAREQARLQEEALRKQQEAELALQKKFLEEERNRVEAERAALAAEQAILDADTKKQRAAAQNLAEEARQREAQAEAARQAAAQAEFEKEKHDLAVAASAAPKGVRPALDYEIEDISLLFRSRPDLCIITEKRREILAELKALEDDGLPTILPGLKTIAKFKVSSR